MDIFCYILGILSVAFGLFTAILYVLDKAKEAFVTKMIASSLFMATGIFAIGIAGIDLMSAAIIVVGMLMSFWGDFFLARKEMSRITSSDNFAYGVYCFAISQSLFILGFLGATQYVFNPYFLFLLITPIVPLVLGRATHMLVFKGKEFSLSVIYGLFLCATLAVCANRYHIDEDISSLLALIGSVLFLVSDLSLGLYYFSSFKAKKLFNFPIMIFYFAAEALYAVSIMV